MRRRYPLHLHISTLFLGLILVVCAVLGGIGYKLSRDLLEASASDLTTRIGRQALAEMQHLIEPAEMATRLLSLQRLTGASSLSERLDSLEFLRQALDSSAALSSLYVGYANGDFFLFGRIGHGSESEASRVPAGATYVVQSIENTAGDVRGHFLYFDAALRKLRDDLRPDYAAAYDPRQRPWYTQGLASSTQIKTPPYLFFSSGKVGTTLANRAADGRSVVGADILLHTLGQTLAGQKATPGSQMVLVNSQGYALAHEEHSRLLLSSVASDGRPSLARIDQLGVPALVPLLETVRNMAGTATRTLRVEAGGSIWRASVSPLRLEGVPPLYLVAAIPEDELMAGALKLIHHSALATLAVLLCTIPLTWLLARSISRSLGSLANEAEAIRHFEFSQPINVESSIKEVGQLALTMDQMKRTIRRFLDISHAVAAEQNFDRLLPRLLGDTLSASAAHAGVLYLAEGQQLNPAVALSADGSPLAGRLPSLTLTACGPLLDAALAAGAARAAPLEPGDRSRLGFAAAELPDLSHAIAVPLLNRQAELVGAMLLLCATATDDSRLSFVQALSGAAAVSLESKALIKAQKDLFEAFIQLIAAAIDAKSPYTGGHCARVPELTKMLARAACAADSGPYRDFQLSEDDWEAVHVAAWLHDCGKVTTPEYVVDKATKLETIHDRLHEVRTRFEVLKRDAQIACLQAIANGDNAQSARQRLAVEWQQIDDDFAFVAACNEGGEYMPPESIDRLQAIARRTWLRTLDDRIGISQEEKLRKAATPAATLPVVEPLLADRPEHRIARPARDGLADDDPRGFRMPVPALLYNRGELYNLSVGRGTLSEEERYKINEHIVQTLIMLWQLPFPRHLKHVPDIAGGHHEKMDGSGYPRRLRGDEMNPLARMMAIADIFEALTAIDRPYKKGKTLSEAIAIMSRMQQEQHIDADLFALFLRSGVYLDYARAFMRPEQIDAVDIDRVLGRR
ncbi:HD domain-containing phosphohydrolase [Accumulibacter sp.]|jgi:HD-GYP domain-containing protein (c-di-GMP phosphodiesterase class II)|uniref:Metal dependent phosphohydrolase n=1 Tax=Accumulibacter regalis TaxID=522306 RepID=C7RLF4_ACCRE|nr:HD domain-containing phosphohydrolase [Accumulibacter sp.]MBN8497933.1 HAMP domain-containing protein [Accumulibacter sp.]MBO3717055.1 HAMP domain-containing protein [Accumulibacter sp.]